MRFSDFDIDPRCLGVLGDLGFEEPTPVQAEVIPVALTGKDVIATAQTGTGKTYAFCLPSFSRLAAGPVTKNAMLVLTPTRELAVQVHSVAEKLGHALGLRIACLYGGVSISDQIRALRRGCSVIVATPGRLLDHLERGSLGFDKLMILVLDEADRMLDMGFLPDIRRIIAKLPDNRQTLMCSATLPTEIERLSNDMLHDPERITVGRISQPVETVRQVLYTVNQENKIRLLEKVAREERIQSALVFLRTRARTDRVTQVLRKVGFKAQAIHGERSQRQRQQALDGFRKGRFDLLVATDVAARGLDIEGLSHVINYDIPENADDYIHRIGRTARAGAEGAAITFVTPSDYLALEAIETTLGRSLPQEEWEGSVPVLRLFESPEEKEARVKLAPLRRRRSLLRRR